MGLGSFPMMLAGVVCLPIGTPSHQPLLARLSLFPPPLPAANLCLPSTESCYQGLKLFVAQSKGGFLAFSPWLSGETLTLLTLALS